MFVSRSESLRDARALVESFCAAAGLDERACAKLTLIVEELFVNTVMHGHGGGADAPVWITLAVAPGAVHLTYEDHAPPFNPFAEGAVPAPVAPVEAQREGGLGVHLTRTFTGEPDYAYLFGRNRLRLAMAV
jgi:anti-sigma regulatory factor (Ser/Thr protein kinase)